MLSIKILTLYGQAAKSQKGKWKKSDKKSDKDKTFAKNGNEPTKSDNNGSHVTVTIPNQDFQ